MISGISGAHYHNNTTEYYLVVSGSGALRVQNTDGELSEVELRAGVIVRIEPKEVHQTNNIDSLILEAITIPAWTIQDELVAKPLF